MSTSRIQMTLKDRRAPLFGHADLMSADHPWAGYSFEEADSPLEPLPSHSWSKTTLLCVTGGDASLQWKHRGVLHNDACRRGTVAIVRRDVEIQSATPSHAFPMLVLQIDPCRLQQVAPEDVLTIEKSLGSVQVASDYRLAALLTAMREEVVEGCPSGTLFAESISLSLLAYLAGTYAAPCRADEDAGPLAPAQKRGIVAYVRANMMGNISVAELAGLAQMSPSQFSRAFKASFGISPYVFVMEERIDRAKDMLARTRLSASQVAMALGFSSQSHFVKVFRRFTGITPKQYRAGL